MFNEIKRFTPCLLAAWLICFSAQAGEPILGAWELACIPPASSMEDTNPYGVLNSKWVFRGDGHMESLEPDQSETNDPKRMANYTFSDDEIDIVFPDRSRRYLSNVDFPNNQTMRIRREDGGYAEWRRIASGNALVEPQSLQLVATEGRNLKPDCSGPSSYGDPDDAKLSLRRRLQGVWEIVMYRNMPKGEVPPYGFTNDLYIIDATTITVRSAKNGKEDIIPYTIEGDVIKTEHRPLTPTFNQWGQLILDDRGAQLYLSRISRSTAKPYPIKPIKVVYVGFPTAEQKN